MAWLDLYPYQRSAVDRMKNGCILCGGVGSGKSRTALSYYYQQSGGDLDAEEYVPMDNPPRDLYIITTAHKRDTFEWEKELLIFLLTPNSEIARYTHKVVVDSWNNIRKYVDIRGSFFIFDEQRVIGKGTWVKAFWKIAKANDWILLSATPGDSWQDYIPVFVANGFYKNRTAFIEQHVLYSHYAKYPVVVGYREQGTLLRYRMRRRSPIGGTNTAECPALWAAIFLRETIFVLLPFCFLWAEGALA